MTTTTSLFKLVCLRAPTPGAVIHPVADTSDDLVVPARLAPLPISPGHLSPEVTDRVRSLAHLVLTGDDLGARRSTDLATKLSTQTMWTTQQLNQAVDDSGSYLRSASFATDYAAVVDSWILLVLTASDRPLQDQHERVIRACHIFKLALDGRHDSHDPGWVKRRLSAHVALPRNWNIASALRTELDEANIARLQDQRRNVPASRRAARTASVKGHYRAEAERIGLWEVLQRKLHVAIQETTPRSEPTSGRRTGSTELTEAFEAQLTDSESELAHGLQDLRPSSGWTPSTLDNAIETQRADAVVRANRLCETIRVFEDPVDDSWRPGTTPHSDVRAAVRALGFGDLVVARESLLRYEATDIALIQNVLAGERRERVEVVTTTTEDVVEDETVTVTETSDEQTVNDRFELAAQTQKTVDRDFSIAAGVNTSGRYGLTKVDTAASISFSNNQSESKSSSIKLAKDVVSRAVERTQESVRQYRRTATTREIKETNSHLLDNTTSAEGGAPVAQSGIYLWVDKVHEVQLINYGTRLMIEFHIPEPGAALLADRAPQPVSKGKPRALAVSPTDIEPGNYLCLSKLYGATGIEPPPAQYIYVGHAWASTPAEDDDADKSEDTLAETLSIPDGYRPVSGTGIVSAQGDEDTFQMYFAVGGHGLLAVNKNDGSEMPDGNRRVDFTFDPSHVWPAGVPLSLRAHGHFDKTMFSQVRLKCERTQEAMMTWRIDTWDAIRAAHTNLVREHEQALEAARFGVAPAGSDRPPAELRDLERDELKRWAISVMRGTSFDFTAFTRRDDRLTLDVSAADLQAPIVRFFEESFEWSQMTYLLYPYFWGDPDSWRDRRDLDEMDTKHEAFLRAGAARLLVPVTPGLEEHTLAFLDTDPNEDDLTRLHQAEQAGFVPSSDVADLWMEIRLARDDDLVRGSGTLSVTNANATMTLSGDSRWSLDAGEVGREVWIGASPHRIVSIESPTQFVVDRPYAGETSPSTPYAVGSLAYGPPWIERTPTSLTVLRENSSLLNP